MRHAVLLVPVLLAQTGEFSLTQVVGLVLGMLGVIATAIVYIVRVEAKIATAVELKKEVADAKKEIENVKKWETEGRAAVQSLKEADMHHQREQSDVKQHVEKLSSQVIDLSIKTGIMEQHVARIDDKVTRVEDKVDRMDQKLDKLLAKQ